MKASSELIRILPRMSYSELVYVEWQCHTHKEKENLIAVKAEMLRRRRCEPRKLQRANGQMI